MTWINGGVCLFAEKFHEPITHKEEASLPEPRCIFRDVTRPLLCIDTTLLRILLKQNTALLSNVS